MVDLPAPFGPTKPVTRPRRAVNENGFAAAELGIVEQHVLDRAEGDRGAGGGHGVEPPRSLHRDPRGNVHSLAKKAVERNDGDSLALISLSALYGQAGNLDEVIKLLSKHEAKMANDVRLANNYFEALFQARQIDKVTKLLNALAGSSNREVKQFAIERSRAVAQYLQQQQQQLQGARR